MQELRVTAWTWRPAAAQQDSSAPGRDLALPGAECPEGPAPPQSRAASAGPAACRLAAAELEEAPLHLGQTGGSAGVVWPWTGSGAAQQSNFLANSSEERLF